MSCNASTVSLLNVLLLLSTHFTRHGFSTVIREYHFELDAKTWNESKLFCDTYYDGLATILTDDDLNRATSLIPTIIGYSIKHIWIGLNDIEIESDWKWDDGTACSFDIDVGHDCTDFWYLWSPNIHGSTEIRDCADLKFKEHWVFGDRSCSNTLPFMCNTNYEYTYVWNETLRNWTDAEVYCNDNHNGMATIRSSDDYLNALQTVPPHIEHIWIGVNALKTDGIWQWSNGDTCANDGNISHDCSVYWKYGEPNADDEDADCGEMKYFPVEEDWLFNDERCSSILSVLCIESDTLHPTVQPTPDIMNDAFALSLSSRSWAESLIYCEENYIGLASILSQGELDAVVQLIPSNVDVMTYKEVWIGLNDVKEEGEWEWSDGSECTVDVIVNNMSICSDLWYEGQPDNYFEREDCGEIRYGLRGTVTGTDGWKINDYHCDYALPVLCLRTEREKEVEQWQSTTHTTVAQTEDHHGVFVHTSDRERINRTERDSELETGSTSISTLDIVLVSTVVALVGTLAACAFCFVRLKKIYKGIDEMSDYVEHSNATKEKQLIQENEEPVEPIVT